MFTFCVSHSFPMGNGFCPISPGSKAVETRKLGGMSPNPRLLNVAVVAPSLYDLPFRRYSQNKTISGHSPAPWRATETQQLSSDRSCCDKTSESCRKSLGPSHPKLQAKKPMVWGRVIGCFSGPSHGTHCSRTVPVGAAALWTFNRMHQTPTT